MPDYYVREENGLIQGKVQANTATDAALNMLEQLLKDPAELTEEWLTFEVELFDTDIEDISTTVRIQHLFQDETLHFPDNVLEPVETPLALTLRKNQDGRSRKAIK